MHFLLFLNNSFFSHRFRFCETNKTISNIVVGSKYVTYWRNSLIGLVTIFWDTQDIKEMKRWNPTWGRWRYNNRSHTNFAETGGKMLTQLSKYTLQGCGYKKKREGKSIRRSSTHTYSVRYQHTHIQWRSHTLLLSELI